MTAAENGTLSEDSSKFINKIKLFGGLGEIDKHPPQLGLGSYKTVFFNFTETLMRFIINP